MSTMVMYRSNSDHNVVCRDIWFRIKRNLGPFLVTFRSLLTSSEVPKVPNFCQCISGSPMYRKKQSVDRLCLTVAYSAVFHIHCNI